MFSIPSKIRRTWNKILDKYTLSFIVLISLSISGTIGYLCALFYPPWVNFKFSESNTLELGLYKICLTQSETKVCTSWLEEKPDLTLKKEQRAEIYMVEGSNDEEALEYEEIKNGTKASLVKQHDIDRMVNLVTKGAMHKIKKYLKAMSSDCA